MPCLSSQSAPEGLRVRTQFPRFQDEYTIILQENHKKNAPTVTGASMTQTLMSCFNFCIETRGRMGLATTVTGRAQLETPW